MESPDRSARGVNRQLQFVGPAICRCLNETGEYRASPLEAKMHLWGGVCSSIATQGMRLPQAMRMPQMT